MFSERTVFALVLSLALPLTAWSASQDFPPRDSCEQALRTGWEPPVAPQELERLTQTATDTLLADRRILLLGPHPSGLETQRGEIAQSLAREDFIVLPIIDLERWVTQHPYWSNLESELSAELSRALALTNSPTQFVLIQITHLEALLKARKDELGHNAVARILDSMGSLFKTNKQAWWLLTMDESYFGALQHTDFTEEGYFPDLISVSQRIGFATRTP